MEYFSFKKKLSVSFFAMLLAASSVQAARKPPPWVQFTGKGYQFCDALLKELKRFDYSQITGSKSICAAELVIPHFTQLKEPPWQKLNPEKHRALLRKMFAGEFYQSEERRRLQAQEDEIKIEQKVEQFISDGGYLRIWKMPFPAWLAEDAHHYNMPVTPLVFIQQVIPRGDKNIKFITDLCNGIPLTPLDLLTGDLVLVNESLDGPDPRTIVYMTPDIYNNHILTMFSETLWKMIKMKNKIYLYKGGANFTSDRGVSFISSGKREWLNENYCQIN